jgi:hypothetical protein
MLADLPVDGGVGESDVLVPSGGEGFGGGIFDRQRDGFTTDVVADVVTVAVDEGDADAGFEEIGDIRDVAIADKVASCTRSQSLVGNEKWQSTALESLIDVVIALCEVHGGSNCVLHSGIVEPGEVVF